MIIVDIERRIFDAVESLRRNSDLSADVDDEQFMTTLRSSARGALSRSFVDILQSKPPPRPAAVMVRKHSVENSIVKSPPPPAKGSSPPRTARCRCAPGPLALAAGLVHGLAGPGGVLGVVPAARLRDPDLAGAYLLTFCAASTLVAGLFAAAYGGFAAWLASGDGGGEPSRGSGRAFVVEMGSALLSVAVGAIWLVLLSIGELEEAFP